MGTISSKHIEICCSYVHIPQMKDMKAKIQVDGTLNISTCLGKLLTQKTFGDELTMKFYGKNDFKEVHWTPVPREIDKAPCKEI